jgi:hypothetical protein
MKSSCWRTATEVIPQLADALETFFDRELEESEP